MAAGHHHSVPGFGPLLRQHRTTAGLSQEALAERAGLSTRAVSDLERGVKTRPHPATMRLLADALDLDAGQRADLVAASRPGAASAAPSFRPELARLPVPHGPIIGRDRELATAVGMLQSGTVRILTLTGPGGVGKTRLMLEIARVIAQDDPGGVAFVELAALANPDLVPAAIAGALRLRDEPDRLPIEVIRDHLLANRTLLVLDNCEHLLGGVRPWLADLVGSVAGLTVLATSRGPLRLGGEHLLPVPPLALPEADRLPDLVALAAIPAIDLFVQRAQAVSPGFALSTANAADVAEICTRLDGLPLAIELAAVRIRSLSPAALARLLSDRLRLLTTGAHDAPIRQQTLRAAIAWSHDALTAAQKVRMWRLAVFGGGFTLESAAAITGDDVFATLDGLDALVDAGLLTQAEVSDGERRYGMLETVREFALEGLAASGESERIRAVHATHLLELVNAAGSHLHGPAPGIGLDRIAAERDNLRAALAWSLGDAGSDGDPAVALRLAAALWPYWHMRGHHQEGHDWLERAVARGKRVDPETRAQAFLTLANIANNLEDHPRAEALYGQSLELFDRLGNTAGAAGALAGLGMVATSQGAYDRAETSLTRALAAWQEAGDPAGTMLSVYAFGRLAVAQGRYDTAADRFDEARALCDPDDVGSLAYLDLEVAQVERLRGNGALAYDLAGACLDRFRQFGERRAEAATRVELAHLAVDANDPGQAATDFLDAMLLHRELGDEFGVITCLEGLAVLAAECEEREVAARLAGAADAWRHRTGTARTFAEGQQFEQLTTRLRDIPGAAIPAQPRAASGATGLDGAVDYAVRAFRRMDKSSSDIEDRQTERAGSSGTR